MRVLELGDPGKPAVKRDRRLVRDPHQTVQLLPGFRPRDSIAAVVRLRQLMKGGVHAPGDLSEPLQHQLEMLSANGQFLDQTNGFQPALEQTPANLPTTFARRSLRHGRRKIVAILLQQESQRFHVRPDQRHEPAFPPLIGEGALADDLQSHPALQHLLQHPDGSL
jgi:hypothetical protein